MPRWRGCRAGGVLPLLALVLLSLSDTLGNLVTTSTCPKTSADLRPRLPQTHQLSTHDELSAQLKIAQSNLTLASSHSDFLEETLRRRDSQHSQPMATRQHSDSAIGPRTRAVTGESFSSRPESSSSSSLHGLGLDDGVESLSSPTMSSTAKSFFARIPSTRRSKPSSRDETPDRSSSPTPSLPSAPSRAISAEISTLKAQVAALGNTNEVLTARCGELEKTKNDLLDELERLSVELFEEANLMVSDERKRRAKAESEVERLGVEVTRLGKIVDVLRHGTVASKDDDLQIALGNSLRHSVDSPRSPDPLPEAPLEDGLSPSASQRKWFSFARKSPLVNPVDSTASSERSSMFSTPYQDASEGRGPDESPDSSSPEVAVPPVPRKNSTTPTTSTRMALESPPLIPPPSASYFAVVAPSPATPRKPPARLEVDTLPSATRQPLPPSPIDQPTPTRSVEPTPRARHDPARRLSPPSSRRAGSPPPPLPISRSSTPPPPVPIERSPWNGYTAFFTPTIAGNSPPEGRAEARARSTFVQPYGPPDREVKQSAVPLSPPKQSAPTFQPAPLRSAMRQSRPSSPERRTPTPISRKASPAPSSRRPSPAPSSSRQPSRQPSPAPSTGSSSRPRPAPLDLSRAPSLRSAFSPSSPVRQDSTERPPSNRSSSVAERRSSARLSLALPSGPATAPLASNQFSGLSDSPGRISPGRASTPVSPAKRGALPRSASSGKEGLDDLMRNIQRMSFFGEDFENAGP